MKYCLSQTGETQPASARVGGLVVDIKADLPQNKDDHKVDHMLQMLIIVAFFLVGAGSVFADPLFGTVCAGPAVVVPEPGALALIAVGGALLLMRRRRNIRF